MTNNRVTNKTEAPNDGANLEPLLAGIPDVKALQTVLTYLEEATLTLIQREGLNTTSEGDIHAWIVSHLDEIVLLARSRQQACLQLMTSDSIAGNSMRKVLCTKVWCDIQLEEKRKSIRSAMNAMMNDLQKQNDISWSKHNIW